MSPSPSIPSLVTGCRTASRAAAIVVALIGTLVLIGWVRDISFLKSIFRGLVTMKSNEAMAVILAGASLWCLQDQRPSWRRWVVWGGASAIILVAGLTLSEYLFEWDLGIDQWLFQEPLISVGTLHPGRMAVINAVCLLGGGLVLALLAIRRALHLAQAITLMIALTVSLALVGYVYKIELLYGMSSYTQVPAHTIVGLLILCCGMLFAHPEDGFMRLLTSNTTGGFLARRLLPASLGVPMVLGWVRLLGERTGLYSPEVGAAMTVISGIVIFALLIWWDAVMVSKVDAERQRAQETLRSLNDALEQRVTERTAELAHVNQTLEGELQERRLKEEQLRNSEEALHQKADELIRSNEALTHQQRVMRSLLDDLMSAKDRVEQQHRSLQAANERLKELAVLKDELIAKVNHELRTPLAAIKEGVSLLLDGALGPVTGDQTEFLHSVDDNIERLTELITNMLDISKIEAGQMQLRRERVSVRPLIEQTLTTYKALAGQRVVNLQVEPVPDVFADPDRVLQILGNLINNAIKFTKEDGTITYLARAQEGSVAISVQDDGMGMTKDDLGKLFQKFSQVGEGRNKLGSSGLGLALCKELVELYGGTITADSEPGKGSMFTFTLPIYSLELALETSFEELRGFAVRNHQKEISVIVLDLPPLMRSSRDPQRLDQVTAFIRQQVHGSDVVIDVEPRYVIVLAASDAVGAAAIVHRLQELAPQSLGNGAERLMRTRLNSGVALYPADGEDIHRLFAKAVERLDIELVRVKTTRGSTVP